MPRIKEDLEKVTIRLGIGDKEELNDFYPRLGYNKVIRKLVSNHLKRLKEKLNQQEGLSHESIIDPNDDHINLPVE